MPDVTITKLYPLPDEPFKAPEAKEPRLYPSGFLTMNGENYHFTTVGLKVEYAEQDYAHLASLVGATIQAKVEFKDQQTKSGTEKVKLKDWPREHNDLQIVEAPTVPGGAGGTTATAGTTVAETAGAHQAEPAVSDLDAIVDEAIAGLRSVAKLLMGVKSSGAAHYGADATPEHRSEGVGSEDGEAQLPASSDPTPREAVLAHYGAGSKVTAAYKRHFGQAKPVAEMTDEEIAVLYTEIEMEG